MRTISTLFFMFAAAWGLARANALAAGTAVYDVHAFGAAGDGSTLDTKAIRTTERYAHLCPDAHEQVVAALQQMYCSSIAKNGKNGEKEDTEAA